MSGAVDGVSMAKLRELAEKATPGEWIRHGSAVTPAEVLWLLDRIAQAEVLVNQMDGQLGLGLHREPDISAQWKAEARELVMTARAWLASVEETP